jgi:hypothetical protein
MTNPILDETLLYKAALPAIYERNQIYDPTWEDPSYANYSGKRIVPAVNSIVRDTDNSQLWVVAVSTANIPSYIAVPSLSDDVSVASLLNYGNAKLRLYIDRRAAPYPVTIDSKCRFLGKSPRSYRLSRYPGQSNQTIISQRYDATDTLVSNLVPLSPIDSSNTSWYMPSCKVGVALEDNEEILLEVFDEAGQELYSAKLFVKESAVINENLFYTKPIAALNVRANQTLADGTFYVYERQDVLSLGVSAQLVYTDGTTADIAIDNEKCFLYGAEDFISSAPGLTQTMTIKYFRSPHESISAAAASSNGEMITKEFTVTVVPAETGVSSKIVPVPYYNSASGQYVVRYFMYFGDGSTSRDVTAYVSIISGTLNLGSSGFGTWQNYTIRINMRNVNGVIYPTNTYRTQNIRIRFGAPTALVSWSFTDSATSPYVYGLDIALSRRPRIKYDATLNKYFVPTDPFGNKAAFINSFFTMVSPMYDANLMSAPQQPTHFLIRDISTGAMISPAMIPVDNYSLAFNIAESIAGQHNNATVLVEFIKQVNASTNLILYGAPVTVSSGSYAG